MSGLGARMPAMRSAAAASVSTSTPAGWSPSRRAVLLTVGRVQKAIVMGLLWGALWMFVTAVCGSLANALPGVTPFEPPRALVLLGVGGVALVGFALVMLIVVVWEAPPRRLARRVLARARALSRRLLGEVFGLAFISGRRLAAAVGLGVVAAFVAFGTGILLAMVPALAASVPPTDARYEAMSGTPAWVPAVFFATYSPAPEEIFYRGTLLVAIALVAALTANRWVRGAVAVVALIVTSWMFGLVHLDWSLLNAVSAGITGAMYGVVAIATRSLWAAIVAHALFNALVFIF